MSIEQEPVVDPVEQNPKIIKVPRWVINQLNPNFDNEQYGMRSEAAEYHSRNSG